MFRVIVLCSALVLMGFGCQKGSVQQTASNIQEVGNDEATLESSSQVDKNKDSDNDGLLDEAELQWKTDMNKPDTDGDGYKDGDEVLNGYNPLGSGRIGQLKDTAAEAQEVTFVTSKNESFVLIDFSSGEVIADKDIPTYKGSPDLFLQLEDFPGVSYEISCINKEILSDLELTTTKETRVQFFTKHTDSPALYLDSKGKLGDCTSVVYDGLPFKYFILQDGEGKLFDVEITKFNLQEINKTITLKYSPLNNFHNGSINLSDAKTTYAQMRSEFEQATSFDAQYKIFSTYYIMGPESTSHFASLTKEQKDQYFNDTKKEIISEVRVLQSENTINGASIEISIVGDQYGSTLDAYRDGDRWVFIAP